MATGLEVFDALRKATKLLPAGSCFSISLFDSYDLCKLSSSDLTSRGFDESTAEEVRSDLLNGRLDKLGRSLGLCLEVDRTCSKCSLVPQQRIRETAGALADEDETLEETLKELDHIRHPERYAS